MANLKRLKRLWKLGISHCKKFKKRMVDIINAAKKEVNPQTHQAFKMKLNGLDCLQLRFICDITNGHLPSLLKVYRVIKH